MKGKKFGVIVSASLIFVTLIAVSIIVHSNSCSDLWLSLLIGVISSAIVTLIISTSDYIIAKREALEDYYFQVSKVIAALGKIEYVHITDKTFAIAKYKTNQALSKYDSIESPQMDDIIAYYNKKNYWSNYPDDLSYDDKKNIVFDEVENECAEIIKSMDSYLKIDNVDFGNIEVAYGRLSFLFDPIKKDINNERYLRVWIYCNLHERLRKMINTIKSTNLHFMEYKNGEAKNLFVVAKNIEQLNKQLFKIEYHSGGGYKIGKIYERFYDDMVWILEQYRAKIYHCQPQKQMTVPIRTIMYAIQNDNDNEKDQ